MLQTIRENKRTQLILGLVAGILFGFLLNKGGATEYDVIIGQLLLRDHTVLKIMLSAVVTGMLGVYALRSLGLAELHPKPGSLGISVIGGLIFGVAFAVLGYCPGTIAGAVGAGWLDAAVGGLVGMILGAGLYALAFPKLRKVLRWGYWSDATLPEVLKVKNVWVVVIPAAGLIIALLFWLESIS